MKPEAIANALIRLTEAPDARLRVLAPEQLNPAERHVLATLELIAVLDDAYFEDDELTVAERLAGLSSAQIEQFDAALTALELPRDHRNLRIAWRALLQGLDDQPPDFRILLIAERHERHCRVLVRLLFTADGIGVRLQQRLAGYLDTHRAEVPDWPRPGNKPVQVRDVAPASARVFHREGEGGKYLFIFRQADAESLLDAWLSEHATEHHTGGLRKSVNRIAEVGKANHWGDQLPEGTLLGRLKPGRTARPPNWQHLCGLQLDEALAALAQDFSWVIFCWPGNYQETPLAWLSTDAALADAWDSNLLRHRRSLPLISRYRQFDTLFSLAGGLQFGEYDNYGAAALVAAESEAWQPWLIASIGAGHGWRRWTRRLQACAVIPSSGNDNALLAYRANDHAAYLALWRDLHRGECVAQATVSGRDDPQRVLHSFMAARCSSSFLDANYLSERHGWIYQHVYGGGSDEHQALFHAQDAAVTQRVAAFAATQRNWYLAGRW